MNNKGFIMKTLYLIVFGVIFFTTQILAQNNKDCTGTSDCVGKIYKETIKTNDQTPLIQVNDFEVQFGSKVSRYLETKSIIRIYNQGKNLSLTDFEIGFYTRLNSEESALISVKNSCTEIFYGDYKGFECSFFSELPIILKSNNYSCTKESPSYLANSKTTNKNSDVTLKDCLIQIEVQNTLDRDNPNINTENDEIYMEVIRIFRSN